MRVATDEPHESPRGMFEPARTRSFGKKQVTPKNASQRRYMEEIEKHDMMFGIGPGGTGKTYIAVAMAVSALLTKQVNRIILARPAVEAGERLGFLPGTLQQKIDPYMRPLYDALYDMLDADKLERFLEKGIIEVAPLAFMRGRTLNDSFVILDEAQNTTSEQMKMFLTRLGFNSKAVITGDVTQIDLPPGKKSGLIEALEVCGKIEGIGVMQFGEKDVVRHNLVQQIIRAYEEYDVAHPQRGGANAGELASGEQTMAGVADDRRTTGYKTAANRATTSARMILNRQRAVRMRGRPLEAFLQPGAAGIGPRGIGSHDLPGERCGDRADE